MPLPDTLFDRACGEVRQQMDGVLALAEQLSHLRLAADAEACVAGMVDASASVRRLVDRLTDLKAVDAGLLKLEPAPLKLDELADAVQANWNRAAARGATPVLVSYDGPPEIAVMADRARLLQVFDGLIAEAAAGAPAKAIEVVIRAGLRGDSVTLHGCVRGASAPGEAATQAAGGLEVSLGVLLSAKMVEGMLGALSRQDAAGGGRSACFDLTLPAAVSAPALEDSAGEEHVGHVLVVDDNATNRVVAQALCDMLHCTSESADDGVQAVEAAGTGRFDVILMDIRMPNMDGVAATRAIRALDGERGRTAIFALTANIDPEDVKSYLAAGMNGVIEKPVKADALREALRQAIGGRADAAAA